MSHSPNKILLLLKKDFLLEWRQKYSLYGVILYIVSTVFTIKMLQDSPDGEVWNSLFWIVILFASINAVAKSFLQESKQRNIYYYSVHDPKDIIISKLIYNVVLMLGMSLITLLLFVLLLGNPSFDFLKFMLLSLLGGVSMALLFTTLAAILLKTVIALKTFRSKLVGVVEPAWGCSQEKLSAGQNKSRNIMTPVS